MAQTRKKRRRKHRGTQAGTIDRAGRTSRSRAREDPKDTARRRRQERLDRPPTFKGAVQRAAIAALIVGVAMAVVPGLARTPVQAASLAVFMFVIYVPLGYLMDKTIYDFRQRRKGTAATGKTKAKK
jgi:Flp pilus assembly protein TadB